MEGTVCRKWFMGKGADDDLHRKWCRNGAEMVKRRRGFLSYAWRNAVPGCPESFRGGELFGLFEAAGEKSSISGRGGEESQGAADCSPPLDRGLRGNSVTNQHLQGF